MKIFADPVYRVHAATALGKEQSKHDAQFYVAITMIGMLITVACGSTATALAQYEGLMLAGSLVANQEIAMMVFEISISIAALLACLDKGAHYYANKI